MIHSSYGNSKNVTKDALRFQGTMLGFQDYLTGQRLYIQGQPPEACENDDQRRGWWDGNKYEAEAEVVA